jgi:hypothetical protein
MNATKLNSEEIKDTLKHVIENNKSLQARGKKPVAISIMGAAGLGKTSSVEELRPELNLTYFEKINLGQMDELGDLVGIPVKEYWMTAPQGKGKWIDEKVISEYSKQGWVLTNNSRMGYSKPSWVAGKGEGGILVLDDYTRAQPRFMQAIMEIVNNQEYISWKLPKNWTVILTENPDDGTYNVSDVDPATRSRFITLNMKFEVEPWAAWAVKDGIDGRCINFMLMHPEIIKDETPEVNPRVLVKFFDSLASIPDFNKQLPLIQILGEGSVGPEVTSMFTSFIHNNLDKMISPKEILDTKIPFDQIAMKVKELVKEGTDYRADLAYVLTQRLINHMLFNVEDSKIDAAFLQRVKDLTVSKVLGSDLKFVLAKKVIASNNKYNSLLIDAEIVDMILD